MTPVEQYLLESSKDRFIDKNYHLNKYEKDLIKEFLDQNPKYNKAVDWNKSQNLDFEAFNEIFASVEPSKKDIKDQTKGGNLKALWSKRKEKDFEILHCTDTDIYITPLSRECAIFMDSFSCYGIGTKWCIGYKVDRHYWHEHVFKNRETFIMRYDNVNKRKYMIQGSIESGNNYDIRVWNEVDTPIFTTRIKNGIKLENFLRKGRDEELLAKYINLDIKTLKELIDRAHELYEEKIWPYQSIDESDFYWASRDVIKKNIVPMIRDLMIEKGKDYIRSNNIWVLAESEVIKQTLEAIGEEYNLENVEIVKKLPKIDDPKFSGYENILECVKCYFQEWEVDVLNEPDFPIL